MTELTGNWASGMRAQRFRIQTKKNRETSSGTKGSPFLPMTSLAIPRWTKSYSASATICSLPGTTFGFEKPAQKKARIAKVPMIASNMGLLNSTDPTVKSGSKMNDHTLGAWNPQSLNRWQFVSKASVWASVTKSSFCMAHGCGYLVVSERRVAAGRHRTGSYGEEAAAGPEASR